MINPRIKKVFNDFLGDDIEIKKINLTTLDKQVEETDLDKNLFCNTVDKWKNAHRVSNTLFTKYGLDFNGYDKGLFEALECLLIYSFGYVKAQITMNFIYLGLNTEETKFRITDKNNKEYFLSSTEELYDFLMKINDEDFLIEEDGEQ